MRIIKLQIPIATILLSLAAAAVAVDSASLFRGASSTLRRYLLDDSNTTTSENKEDDEDNHDAILFDRKQLVMFAGPHSSGSTSVEQFFEKWAADGWKRGHPHSIALQYWRWPIVSGKYGNHGYKVFSRLVNEPDNDEVHRSILDSIAEKFEEAQNGVFFGTEEFDQVSEDKINDGLKAMKKVVAHLNLQPSDVTVVLNYRAPRLDQWVSIWKHQEGKFENSTYEGFLCLSHSDEEERQKRYNMIGCQMNPLGAANIFLEQGWKVHLIDMGGVETAERDISHAIGCRVLGGTCRNGFLGSHESDLPRENAIEKPFDELNDDESAKIEQLFRNRDCGYQPMLQKAIDDERFVIEYQDSLWHGCDPSRKKYYSDLVGATSSFYHAFRSQLKCKDAPQEKITMDKALGKSAVLEVIGDFIEAIIIPCILLGGLGYLAMAMMKGAEQRRLDANAAASGAACAEMTPYPSSAFRDEGEDEDEIVVETVPEDED